MALRKTFGEIIEATLSEASLSTNTSRGTDRREHVKQVIRRHYSLLLEEYDWEHLKLKRDDSQGQVLTQAGLRNYNFPAALNPMKIDELWIKWGSSWHKADYGIDIAHYNGDDSDEDQRTDPVLRWSRWGDDQFEVHPLPASDGVEMRFVGQKLGEMLVADGSRADIDDIVLYLRSAATILAESGQKDASQEKLSAAGARLSAVRAGYSDQTKVRVSMGDAGPRRFPRVITHVR